MIKSLSIGSVVLVDLPFNSPRGREQQGKRPCVVAGIPQDPLRFPLLMVVPLTSQTGTWATDNPVMYPTVSAGIASLSSDSVALVDQTRAIDTDRIISKWGTLTDEEYEPIKNALGLMMGSLGRRST